ncbi:MAG: hypothetical protein M3Z00_06620 [Actinomycetota bacterium]|nr:hypothetical protein [Actinomycetota bacterium]
MTTELGLPMLRSRLVGIQGFSDRQLREMVEVGGWQRLRQGVYLPEGVDEYAEQRHRWLVNGTVARLSNSTDAVVSHSSAAVLHGLPVWGLDLSRVHLTRPGRAGINSTCWVHPHRAQLTDAELTAVDGTAVTTVARTVLDIARSAPFTQSVVVADAASHVKATTTSELAAVLDIARQRGSARGAARVIAFADGLSESVGESRSRVLFAGAGFPAPVLQVRLHDEFGEFVARVDFDFDELRTAGEFDGLGKYTTLLRPGLDPADSVIEEKIREDRIRDTGRQVVRWTSKDLATPHVVLHRLRAAFNRAGFPDGAPSSPGAVPGSANLARAQAR